MQPLQEKGEGFARYGVALVLLLAGAACAEREEPDPTPTSDTGGYNMVAPVPDPAKIDAEREGFTPGQWTKAAVDGAAGISFAAPGQEPVFRIYCHGRGGLVFERLQKESIGDVELMEVQAGTQVTRLAVNEVESNTRRSTG